MKKRIECKGCAVRIEIAIYSGGFDKYGYCAGCIKASREAWVGSVVDSKAYTGWGGFQELKGRSVASEWSPEIAEAMRISQ